MTAMIDTLRWEPVPGKPGAFRLFDKETGEPFDVGDHISRCRPPLDEAYKKLLVKHGVTE